MSVAPSGGFVYGSNRGHDSIVIYRVDAETGRLSYVGHESTRGRTPRNFAIDPNGEYLLAANQDSDTIVTFRIDARTGELHATGQVIEVPTPVCVKFLAQGA
jgi:6-phosphogluconolactonase